MSKHTLLLVDDEPELINIMREVLAKCADRIVTASNGAEAIALLEGDKTICAILCDISMPVMTGLELLEKLRSQYNPIPFVILTGYGNQETLQEAIRLNATDFLDKPFKRRELKAAVTKALEYGKEMSALEAKLTALYGDSKEENVIALKRMKRTTWAMRIESSVYMKRKRA